MVILTIAVLCLLFVMGSLIGMFLGLGMALSAWAGAILALCVILYWLMVLTD